jgi:hypothetical protein
VSALPRRLHRFEALAVLGNATAPYIQLGYGSLAYDLAPKYPSGAEDTHVRPV